MLVCSSVRSTNAVNRSNSLVPDSFYSVLEILPFQRNPTLRCHTADCRLCAETALSDINSPFFLNKGFTISSFSLSSPLLFFHVERGVTIIKFLTNFCQTALYHISEDTGVHSQDHHKFKCHISVVKRACCI